MAALVGVRAGRASIRARASTEIYSVDPDRPANFVDLTNNAANDSFPVESPRGGRLAFVSDRDGYDAVYVMNEDGSDQHRLTDRITEAPNTICHLSEPAWSPGGASIAFTTSCVLLDGDPRNILTFIDLVSSAGGSVRELVAGGSDPSFSADGRFVAYEQQTTLTASPSVGFVAARGSRPISLGSGYGPGWSPTGHRLAFHTGPVGIAVVNVVRPRRRWTLRNATAGAPAWSPRRNLIAFSSGGPRPGIYVAVPGGRRASRLVDLGEWAEVHWSPNGRWLALSGAASTYVVRADGRFLARVGGGGSEPVWSRDSARVAWADQSLGNAGLMVAKPRGATKLVAQSTEVDGITWTHDSSRVIFASACATC